MKQNTQILLDHITFKMCWLPSAMQSHVKLYQRDWNYSRTYFFAIFH